MSDGAARPATGAGQHGSRAGFSLVEAMVVLVISAMAVLLAFAAAERAAQTAFRLGRRSLDTADTALDEESFRVLIRGLTLAPQGVIPSSVGVEAIAAAPNSLQGGAVLAHATPCADAGPVQSIRLKIEHRPAEDVVTCQVNQGAPVVLMHLGPHRAAFSYAVDGRGWFNGWSEDPRPQPPAAGRRLMVRLASADGAVELVETASSGPPNLYQTVTPAARGEVL